MSTIITDAVTALSGNLALAPEGSGVVTIDGLTYPAADGSANQVMKTNGSGVLSFTDAGGGGTAVIARATFSSANTVAITGFDSSKYDAYKIFYEMTPSQDGADVHYKTSTNGGSSYDGGGSDYYWRHIINDPGAVDYNSTGDSKATTTRGASNGGFIMASGTGEHMVGEVTIVAPDNTGYTLIMADHTGFHASALLMYSKLVFARLSAADVDAIQLSPSGGTVNGRYVFMGINNSVT